MHGGVNDAIAGHPETPCPFNSVNDEPNDVRLKQNADAFVKGAVSTIISSRAWTAHSAIFIVADEGDFTGNAVNGRLGLPCRVLRLPHAARRGPRHQRQHPVQPLLDAADIEDAWGLPELAFTSDHAQVATMSEFLAR